MKTEVVGILSMSSKNEMKLVIYFETRYRLDKGWRIRSHSLYCSTRSSASHILNSPLFESIVAQLLLAAIQPDISNKECTYSTFDSMFVLSIFPSSVEGSCIYFSTVLYSKYIVLL